MSQQQLHHQDCLPVAAKNDQRAKALEALPQAATLLGLPVQAFL